MILRIRTESRSSRGPNGKTTTQRMLTRRHSGLTEARREQEVSMQDGPLEKTREVTTAQEPLDALRALVDLRRELDEAEARHVEGALHEGRSWAQVAEALGISKQAAHKRHA